MKVLSDSRKLSLTTIISVRTTNSFRRLHSAKLWQLTAKWSWLYQSGFSLWARLAVIEISSFSRKQIYFTVGKQRYTRDCTSNLNAALWARRTVAIRFQELTEVSIFFLSGSSGHKHQTSNSMAITKSLKPHTDSLIFQDTAMLGLLGIATARFAKSGETMLLFDRVEVHSLTRASMDLVVFSTAKWGASSAMTLEGGLKAGCTLWQEV